MWRRPGRTGRIVERRLAALEKLPMIGTINLQQVAYLNKPNMLGSVGTEGRRQHGSPRAGRGRSRDPKVLADHHKLIPNSCVILLHGSVKTSSQFERILCDSYNGSFSRFRL